MLHLPVSNRGLLLSELICVLQTAPGLLLRIKLACAALPVTDLPCAATLLIYLSCGLLLLLLLLPACTTLPLTPLTVHLAAPVILLNYKHVSLTTLKNRSATWLLVMLVKVVCLLLLWLSLQAAQVFPVRLLLLLLLVKLQWVRLVWVLLQCICMHVLTLLQLSCCGHQVRA
jgi:hypothetical protein